MTQYEVGKWYGWNGGKCPVHPKSLVQVILLDGNKSSFSREYFAGDWYWDDDDYPIVAFQITKEHKEPREYWIQSGQIFLSKPRDILGEEIIHVKEVKD